MHITDTRPFAHKGAYDVLVVGGGIAGVAAAVAAARAGAKTLLMEKSIVLGGLATAGLINWYEPLCDSDGQKMMSGIAEELIRLSTRYGFGNVPAQWAEGVTHTDPPVRFASFFSPTIFAMALDEYLKENKVEILLDCLAVFPVMDEGVCKGIAAEIKEGRAFFAAQAVVDATGDAGVFCATGADTAIGHNHMSYVAHGITGEAVAAYAETHDMLRLRKWMNVGSDMTGRGQPEGIPPAFGITGEDITKFVLTGRALLFDAIKAQDVNERDITMLPFMPQYRTIRRIVGKVDFIALQDEPVDHPVGHAGDFRRGGRGKHYAIPFEALYNASYPNLVAAGRIISAPYGDGWEIARVIPTCALTGQAAGVAAALCAQQGKSLDALDYASLRAGLLSQGVLL